LDETQCAYAKVLAENREVSIKEDGRPADLGHDEDQDLEYDKQTVDDTPCGTSWFVWYCAIWDVLIVSIVGTSEIRTAGHKSVDSPDVVVQSDDVACKGKDEGDETEGAYAIQANEDVNTKRRHLGSRATLKRMAVGKEIIY
jgi:hypothetical protein